MGNNPAINVAAIIATIRINFSKFKLIILPEKKQNK